MIPRPDHRSPERRALDEQLAAEPLPQFPDFPPGTPTAPIEVHLAALRRSTSAPENAETVSPLSSLNSEIELHDSTLDSVEMVDRDLVIRVAPAYVHRSARRPGIDPGTGWVQDVDLVVFEAVVESLPSELPCWLADGTLVVGEATWDNTIPLPLAAVGDVFLSAITANSEHLVVRGEGIKAVPRGEPTYVEESPG